MSATVMCPSDRGLLPELCEPGLQVCGKRVVVDVEVDDEMVWDMRWARDCGEG